MIEVTLIFQLWYRHTSRAVQKGEISITLIKKAETAENDKHVVTSYRITTVNRLHN